ncbi:MAG: hypothetical protein ACJAVQ_001903 [Nonlabens sp.]|jgi:hypothetical protein
MDLQEKKTTLTRNSLQEILYKKFFTRGIQPIVTADAAYMYTVTEFIYICCLKKWSCFLSRCSITYKLRRLMP